MAAITNRMRAGGRLAHWLEDERALWTAQVVLAVIFLFAGGVKLTMSSEDLTRDFPLSAGFLRFIAVAEACGGLGMLLPPLLRLPRALTPLAACGLTIIMAGATVLTLADGGGAYAAMPFVIGVLAVFVAVGRRAWITSR